MNRHPPPGPRPRARATAARRAGRPEPQPVPPDARHGAAGRPVRLVIDTAGPVTLAERRGVFAHSFKCLACRVEVVVLSWVPDRHTTATTFCPECGQQSPKIHWGAVLSQSPAMVLDGSSIEVFHVVPLGPAHLLADSTLPDPPSRPAT